MAINFEQVNFSYGAGTTLAQPILHDINVTIPDGQVTAIIGQTGSGQVNFHTTFKWLIETYNRTSSY